MTQPKYNFFYGGPFSQWYPSPFISSTIPFLPDMSFTCAEQYMMAAKAVQFGDVDTLEQIMATDDPREQKALGRSVKNFDKDVWGAMARDVVYAGNLAKFTSTESLRNYILDTNDDILVEASPTDRIWGIGLGMTDSRRFDPTLWEGTNWLGEALMRVRTTIRLFHPKPESLIHHDIP